MYAKLVSWALEGDPAEAQFKPFQTFTGVSEAEANAKVFSFMKIVSKQQEWYDVMWEIRPVSAGNS